MNELPPIDLRFRAEIIRRDPSAEEWLRALPENFQAIASRWGLSLDGAPSYGKTSIVLPVSHEGRPAVLKLVSTVVNIESEARALNLFAGNAMVKIFESSIPDRALLLDRLAGPMLTHHTDPTTAVEIAGCIASQLGSVKASPDIPKLAMQAVGWSEGIRQQHELANEVGNAVPDEIYRAARSIIKGLANDTSINLTHGDLSLENIMRASNGTWVAIDPLLICGTIANEAHTVIRSLLPLILDADSPSQLLGDLMKKFCNAAGIDYSLAQRISLARYVASYYWEAQNNGDATNIDRLRQAANLTYQLIT